MIYHKFKLTDNVEVKAELYEDEIFTDCPDCGKEIEVTLADFCHIYMEEADLAGTSFFCNECTKKRQEIHKEEK